MKTFLKLLAALAAIGGVIALLARYSDKLKALCPCCKCKDCDCEDCDCQSECDCQEPGVLEGVPAAEEAPVEEAEEEVPVEEVPAAEETNEESVTAEDFVD